MRNSNLFIKLFDTYFAPTIDLRVQAFHVIAIAGMAAGSISGLSGLSAGMGALHVVLNFLSSVAAFLLLYVTRRFNWYRFSVAFTVIVIFMLMFPAMFFTGGGYRSGMPCFFVFALIFTVLMLENAARVAAFVTEAALYIGCVLIAYHFPESITDHFDEWYYAQDVIVGMVFGGGLPLIIILLYMRIYNNHRKQLAEANERLDALNRVKTEFLEDIKHEIRTPLTTISLGTDVALNNAGAAGDEQKVRKALNTVQNATIRLGRMINGMVELATMSEKPQNRKRIDFAAMLRTQAEAARFETEAKGNTLRVEIAAGLPYVYAEAEQLERVPANLLGNAARFTRNGDILLHASAAANFITVRISDTGEGVSPELLPKVFERGVSGSGSKGYGLYMCKTIVDAHGGVVEIESEQSKGCTVTFTIPVYGGQDNRAEWKGGQE